MIMMERSHRVSYIRRNASWKFDMELSHIYRMKRKFGIIPCQSTSISSGSCRSWRLSMSSMSYHVIPYYAINTPRWVASLNDCKTFGMVISMTCLTPIPLERWELASMSQNLRHPRFLEIENGFHCESNHAALSKACASSMINSTKE